jgi:hypothetical protein
LHSGESAISNITAVGWSTISRNPGLPHDCLKLVHPRHTGHSRPYYAKYGAMLLRALRSIHSRIKMKRRVRGVGGERLTYTSVQSDTTTGSCHEPMLNTSHQEVFKLQGSPKFSSPFFCRGCLVFYRLVNSRTVRGA